MSHEKVKKVFTIDIIDDAMLATINCPDVKLAQAHKITEDELMTFLQEHKIVYGINEQAVQRLTKNVSSINFPLTIAKGEEPVDGTDGYIVYDVEMDEKIKVSPDEKINFRDVIRIPTVKEGEKLATIVDPVKGKDGKNIYGKQIRHKPGKSVLTRAGKNVVYKESDQSFYATSEGQISIDDYLIEVHPVYEINESLSMKTGNINFVGSVVIRGDVPTGYEVKAGGDVKIFGIVEAAQIEAGGSVFISEGFAGLQKGKIKASGDVHIGYINQGNVQTKGSIYVEQSIVHSVCVAANEVICKVGSIIGGSITASQIIEAKDVGNRLSTKTEINFTLAIDYYAEKEKLLNEKEQLEQRLTQLKKIGDKLTDKNLLNNPQIREMFKKQRQSLIQTNDQLKRVMNNMQVLDEKIKTIDRPKLVVRQTLYPQVIVSFGKYKRNFQAESSYVYVTIEGNEIVIHAN
ncbi:MAG TPA: FapA family protein [Bacillota bacterium]|nr:FapA family protein [Bacillota bacterium]